MDYMKKIYSVALLSILIGFTFLTGCIKEDADLPPVKYFIINEFFNDTLGDFTQYSVTGTSVWTDSFYKETTYAFMSGYNGSFNANEDWLISKPINFDNYTDEVFTFKSAMDRGIATDTSLKVYYSKDYSGNGNPSLASWTRIAPVNLSQGDFVWVNSGKIDLSAVSGDSVYIAFKYVCSTYNIPSWEITAVNLQGNLK